MPQDIKNQQKPSRTKRIFKYNIVAMFSVIIAKWIVLEFVPTSSLLIVSEEVKTTTQKESTTQPIVPKEVNLTIDFLPIQKNINKEYESARTDINRYIAEVIAKQKQQRYYALSFWIGYLYSRGQTFNNY